MSVVVRSARAEDIQFLGELFLKFSNSTVERSETLHKAIRDPSEELLVAELEGHIVAFIHQVFFNDPFHGGISSNITSLFVKEEHRRARAYDAYIISRGLISFNRFSILSSLRVMECR